MSLDRWTTEVFEVEEDCGILLPKALSSRLKIQPGDVVEITFRDEIRIRPLEPVFCPHCGKELTEEEGIS